MEDPALEGESLGCVRQTIIEEACVWVRERAVPLERGQSHSGDGGGEGAGGIEWSWAS